MAIFSVSDLGNLLVEVKKNKLKKFKLEIDDYTNSGVKDEDSSIENEDSDIDSSDSINKKYCIDLDRRYFESLAIGINSLINQKGLHTLILSHEVSELFYNGIGECQESLANLLSNPDSLPNLKVLHVKEGFGCENVLKSLINAKAFKLKELYIKLYETELSNDNVYTLLVSLLQSKCLTDIERLSIHTTTEDSESDFENVEECTAFCDSILKIHNLRVFEFINNAPSHTIYCPFIDGSIYKIETDIRLLKFMETLYLNKNKISKTFSLNKNEKWDDYIDEAEINIVKRAKAFYLYKNITEYNIKVGEILRAMDNLMVIHPDYRRPDVLCTMIKLCKFLSLIYGNEKFGGYDHNLPNDYTQILKDSQKELSEIQKLFFVIK